MIQPVQKGKEREVARGKERSDRFYKTRNGIRLQIPVFFYY